MTLAALSRLARSGTIDPDGTVVAYLTGNGVKTPDVGLPAENAAIPIAPTLAAFEASLSRTTSQLVEV